MAEERIREIKRLTTESLENIPTLIQVLENWSEEMDKEIAKARIRLRFICLIPDFILKLFYSEFREAEEMLRNGKRPGVALQPLAVKHLICLSS